MDNIRIAVRDSTDSYNVAFFDNESGIKFKTPNLTKFLAGSASMLSLSFNSKDIDTVKTGCKLSFVYKNKPYWLNIMDIQKTGFKINLIAYSLVLEINNEQKGSYKSDEAQSIAQYVRIFDPENSLTIGINELADKSIKLEWTGTDTLLDRLYSIANSFDAELEFVTEVNSDYSLKRHVLNIYRKGKLGKDLTGQPVRVGKDLKVINYSDNIKELYSAVHATGKDGLTIAGLTKTVNDDAGKPLYVTDGACLRAPQTRDRFPAVGRNSADNYLLLDLGSTEYETKEALYGYMLTELKKTSVPKVSYTAEGSMDGEIADKMTLIDDLHFDPPLYVQARISEMTEDIITGRVTETTFTNYERKYSQLSDDLLKRVEELAKEAMPYTLDLATNNGTIFKNGAGNSQITPTLKRGSETISGASFVWTINGTSTTASTYTVSAAAVSGTAVVKVEAILAGKVVATTEVTFTDVSDGADGVAGKNGKGITGTVITYGISASETTLPATWSATVPTLIKGQYLWTKTVWTYTDNTNETGYTKTYIAKDGNNGTDGIAGKDGVGISSTSITYARSASGISAPTSGWTSAVPTVPPGEFLWTKTVWTYSDNTTETGYSVAKMGVNGDQGPQGIQGIQGPKGDQGIPGVKGADGKTQYTHIAYADNSTGGGFSQTDQTKAYIGMYQDFIVPDSTNPASYRWTKWKGSDGAQGIPGPKGADGQTPYIHFAYSDNADGTGLTTSDNGQRYIGQYSDYTQADSTDKTKYHWADRWAKIEVGGRNLWIQSKATGGFVEESLPDNHITGQKKCYKLTNNTSLYFNIEPNFSPRLYKKVTFSAWIKYENVVQGTNYWNEFNCFKHSMVGKNSSAGAVTTGTDYLTLAGFTGTSEWKYITYTYDYSANKSYDQLKTPIFFNLEGVNSGTAWVTGIMIQFGTVATGHEWAPEDIEKELDSKADQDKVVYKTDISVTDEGIVHSASKTVNGQTIASMIAQRAEWVEIIANLLKVKGDMIVDGTISANKLSISSLSALAAELGQISGGSLELLESVAQGTSLDAWGSFTIPAHKWGLYIDNIGTISSGTPVRKSSSESVASDMPIAVLTSGQLRFARVDQDNDLESVLHHGLSDSDNATISFGVASDGTKHLLIQANGQIVNQATNYTFWISTGVAGVYYKRQGDVVALKMQVTTTANQTLNLGKIPVSLLPIPNSGMMMRVTAWTAEQSFGRNLQINGDGTMVLLASNRGDAFNTQVTWII